MVKQHTKTKPITPQPTYISHDKLFKEFLERFLPEFLDLFFPDKAARLNFNKAHFFGQELIVNLPGQVLRITDMVAEVALLDTDAPALKTDDDQDALNNESASSEVEENEPKENDTEVIIVHVDVEANRPKSIPYRMFEYYSLLRVIKKRPVLPIALLVRRGTAAPGTDSIGIQTYTEKLWDEELVKFHYYQVVLQDLQSEDYLRLNDPVAACLAALMKHAEEESAIVKKRSYDIIGQSELSDGDKVFLAQIVNVYLSEEKIKGAPEEIMVQLMEHEKTWLEITWDQGEISGQQKILIKQILTKFGLIANEVIERIKIIKDENILGELATQILQVQSLDELTLPKVDLPDAEQTA